MISLAVVGRLTLEEFMSGYSLGHRVNIDPDIHMYKYMAV